MVLSSDSKYPNRRAYVVKLRSDATPDALIGRLENLVTGRRGEFTSARELLRLLVGDMTNTRLRRLCNPPFTGVNIMDMTSVTALSGVLGTLVGVSATGAVAWINQKTLHRRELVRDDMRMRQEIYGEFLAECAKLLVDAFQHTLEKPETFVPVYGLINRIRLCATKPVLTEAERLVGRLPTNTSRTI